MTRNNNTKPLFHLFGTPVVVEPSALMAPLNMFGLALWLTGGQPTQYSWPRRLWIGICAMAAYVLADVAHFGGHILSSRAAQAPMDEVHIKAPMPQSVYNDDAVSPAAHRMRSAGGPLGSGVAYLLSVILRSFTRRNSLMYDFLNVSAIAHALVGLGSMQPLPMIDGGIMLKWSLIEGGKSEARANYVVELFNLALGILSGLVGSLLAMRKQFKPGLALLVLAASAITAGLGKLR